MSINKISFIFVLILSLIILISSVSAITGTIGGSRIILRDVEVGDVIERNILVRNTNDVSVDIELFASGDLGSDITIIDNEFTLAPNEEKKAYFTIEVTKEGTTEGEINVEFTPVGGGNGVGLSSTIIVETLDYSLFEIISPIDDSILKQDFVDLFVESVEDVICEYSLNDAEFEEMEYTGEKEHFQSIFDLEDTTITEDYEIDVRCYAEDLVLHEASIDFEIDLSKLEEYLIMEDIGDYEYLFSLEGDYELFSDFENIAESYYAFYEKEEDFRQWTTIFEFESEEEMMEFLKNYGSEGDELEGEIIVKEIDDLIILTYADEDMHFSWWMQDNLGIYVFNVVNPEIENTEEVPFPEEIVLAYLEKYPSDLEEEDFVDSDSPVIDLVSPRDDYTKKTSSSSYEIDFRYEVNDDSEIESCSLIIDGDVEEIDNNVQRDVVNVFSVDLKRDDYNWKVKCVDVEGNERVSEKRDLEIERKSSSRRSSSYSRDVSSNSLLGLKSNNVYMGVVESSEVIDLGGVEIGGSKVSGRVVGGSKGSSGFGGGGLGALSGLFGGGGAGAGASRASGRAGFNPFVNPTRDVSFGGF